MTATVTQMRDREPLLARTAIWDKALEILVKEDSRLAHVFDDAMVNRLTESHWQIITDNDAALALSPPVLVAMIRQATLHVTPTLYGKHAGDPFWPHVEVVSSRDLLDELVDGVEDKGRLKTSEANTIAEDPSVAGSSLLEPHRPVVHLDSDTLAEGRLDEIRLRSLREIREALKVSVTLLDEEIARLEDD